MTNPSHLRERLQRITARISDPRAPWSERSMAAEDLAELAEEAASLADQAQEPELLEQAAEVLYAKASRDLGRAQSALWFELHPQLRRVALVGESTCSARGYELAAWAHLRAGERLVDRDDPQGSPNDRTWGARELHEAVRLGRQAATAEGLVHAALAGVLLARILEEEGKRPAAQGSRAGVCATRMQATETLDDAALAAFDRELADALGEAPAGWCAKRR